MLHEAITRRRGRSPRRPRRRRRVPCPGRLPQPDLRNLDVYRDLALADDYEGIERIRIEDLAGHYRALLAARDRVRPVPEDARLWTPKARTAARESA